jgi:hypothetical protein
MVYPMVRMAFRRLLSRILGYDVLAEDMEVRKK